MLHSVTLLSMHMSESTATHKRAKQRYRYRNTARDFKRHHFVWVEKSMCKSDRSKAR